MEKIIMHIDVNNAFLSWTAVLRLKQGEKDIRNTYAIIASIDKPNHGIVLAKSMPAKKLGIVTAETIYSAKKKCPNLNIYPPNYSFYKQMSNNMMNLIRSYSPDIEQMSIDECFLDYTPVKHLYGNELQFAYKLKKEIKDKLGFTVNIGIANNKLCAKMASDFSKPYKVHTLYSYEIKNKMWPLQVDDLFGIGKQTALKLHKLNINTIYDLAHYNQKQLYKHFKNQAQEMISKAQGIGSDIVNSSQNNQKGIGNEITLNKNIFDKAQLNLYLLALSENVSLELRKQNKYAYVVSVTLKDKFFKRYTHQKTLINAINLAEEVNKASIEILNEMNIENGVRLIGIRLDKLVETPTHQVSLFESIETKKQSTSLEKTVDNLKQKYGVEIIKKASLLNNKISKKY